jgi:hypothetical protein
MTLTSGGKPPCETLAYSINSYYPSKNDERTSAWKNIPKKRKKRTQRVPPASCRCIVLAAFHRRKLPARARCPWHPRPSHPKLLKRQNLRLLPRSGFYCRQCCLPLLVFRLFGLDPSIGSLLSITLPWNMPGRCFGRIFPNRSAGLFSRPLPSWI